jgi:hypothetical protein
MSDTASTLLSPSLGHSALLTCPFTLFDCLNCHTVPSVSVSHTQLPHCLVGHFVSSKCCPASRWWCMEYCCELVLEGLATGRACTPSTESVHCVPLVRTGCSVCGLASLALGPRWSGPPASAEQPACCRELGRKGHSCSGLGRPHASAS